MGETCGRDYSILGRSVRNVRVLTAVVFYTLAFQLADILASQNYFGSDYGERPDTGLSKNRHPIEGRSLEKTLFDGDLELWMNKEKASLPRCREGTHGYGVAHPLLRSTN